MAPEKNEPELRPLDWKEYADRPDRERLPFWKYFVERDPNGGDDDHEPRSTKP